MYICTRVTPYNASLLCIAVAIPPASTPLCARPKKQAPPCFIILKVCGRLLRCVTVVPTAGCAALAAAAVLRRFRVEMRPVGGSATDEASDGGVGARGGEFTGGVAPEGSPPDLTDSQRPGMVQIFVHEFYHATPELTALQTRQTHKDRRWCRFQARVLSCHPPELGAPETRQTHKDRTRSRFRVSMRAPEKASAPCFMILTVCGRLLRCVTIVTTAGCVVSAAVAVLRRVGVEMRPVGGSATEASEGCRGPRG